MKNKKVRKHDELTEEYRPRLFKDIIGQSEAIKQIRSALEHRTLSHAIMLTGPSGCGKTTLARILKDKLGCTKFDYVEVNAADARGIQMVREISERINTSAIGKCRVWCIDEAHAMTSEAKVALLKVLENAPQHAYIILCTTEPQKLLRTIVTRCIEIKLGSLSGEDIRTLINNIAANELGGGSKGVDDDVLDRIVEVAEGSARKAVKVFQQIMHLKSSEEMLAAVELTDARRVAFDLVKALIPFKGRPEWNEVKKVLEAIKDEDPEGIRRLVISVCGSHMVKGNALAGKSRFVFECFRDNYYDTNRIGLIASCWDAVHSK